MAYNLIQLERIGSQSKKEEVTNAKDEKIFLLERELMNFKNRDLLVAKASKEVAILFPEVKSISFGDLILASTEGEESGTRPSLIIKWKRKSSINPIGRFFGCPIITSIYFHDSVLKYIRFS